MHHTCARLTFCNLTHVSHIRLTCIYGNTIAFTSFIHYIDTVSTQFSEVNP